MCVFIYDACIVYDGRCVLCVAVTACVRSVLVYPSIYYVDTYVLCVRVVRSGLGRFRARAVWICIVLYYVDTCVLCGVIVVSRAHAVSRRNRARRNRAR